jgi:lipoprotein-releasing system ATP-binding protein
MEIIKTINIKKNYGTVEVLKGINMQVEHGEIVAIVGSSGAGKTTLLQLLGTLDQPSSGQILFEGNDISKLKGNILSDFRNQHIGFVFQFHHLLPEFTALENVCIPAWIGKSNKTADKKSVEAKAMELLAFLGVDHRKDNKPSQLSGGEAQRVAVARSLINSPKVIFADEPTGNLDSSNAKELHKLFFELRKKYGQTFVIVTHNEELANSADRIIHIADGVIV